MTEEVEVRLALRPPVVVGARLPSHPVPARHVLPVVRDLADEVVSRAVEAARRDGQPVSCRAGCVACCRQLVPLSPVEARGVAEQVASLPDERRAQVVQRFDAARERLREVGLHELLGERRYDGREEELAVAFYAARIRCPFLSEEDTCSIYATRPLVCREHMVATPAAACETPTPETVRRVPLEAELSRQSGRLEHDGGAERWIPLIHALAWVEERPESAARRTAAEHLGVLLGTAREPRRWVSSSKKRRR